MKKIIFSVALLMGFAAASFAGNPKDSKSETFTQTTSNSTMVWYKVTYDAGHPLGYIPAGSTSLADDRNEAEALEECEPGVTRDCLRGFNNAPTLPTGNSGDDQIKTDEQP